MKQVVFEFVIICSLTLVQVELCSADRGNHLIIKFLYLLKINMPGLDVSAGEDDDLYREAVKQGEGLSGTFFSERGLKFKMTQQRYL